MILKKWHKLVLWMLFFLLFSTTLIYIVQKPSYDAAKKHIEMRRKYEQMQDAGMDVQWPPDETMID